MNIPDIGFGSYTLFPDQQSYGSPDPYLDSYTNTVNSGIDWILMQAQSAAAYVRFPYMESVSNIEAHQVLGNLRPSQLSVW